MTIPGWHGAGENMSTWGKRWQAERVEWLEYLYHQGLRCREIARRMGITKNAVIGKLYRMGHIGWRPPPPPQHYPIDDLLDREKATECRCCRWPIGHPDKPDFHYCCAPVETFLPYCGEHAASAYLKPQEDAAL